MRFSQGRLHREWGAWRLGALPGCGHRTVWWGRGRVRKMKAAFAEVPGEGLWEAGSLFYESHPHSPPGGFFSPLPCPRGSIAPSQLAFVWGYDLTALMSCLLSPTLAPGKPTAQPPGSVGCSFRSGGPLAGAPAPTSMGASPETIPRPLPRVTKSLSAQQPPNRRPSCPGKTSRGERKVSLWRHRARTSGTCKPSQARGPF